MIAAQFAPTKDGKSKALKHLSGAYHVDYIVNGTSYTLVIPPEKRKVKWNKAVAFLPDGSISDVTELMKPYAGPHGNFLNIEYRPRHLLRGASAIKFYHDNNILVEFIEPN